MENFSKGCYHAKTVKAKFLYPYANKDRSDPYAIELKHSAINTTRHDINSFRPDPRDIRIFSDMLNDKGANVIVLYEKINCVNNSISSVPRYIIWENDKNIISFVNVR